MPSIESIYNHYIIDMSSNNNFVQIPTMQGDGNNVRGFEVELISNGTQYIVDKNNTIVSIMGTKPDTCQVLNECGVTDEGYILVDITSQMSAVKGRGDYSIVLMDKSTNSQLKSFPFYIITTPAPFNISEIVSSDEFQLLTKTIFDAGTVTDEARQEIKNVQDLEVEFSANEEIRITNESQRIDNEAVRQKNEDLRISNESNRQNEELKRDTAEEIRIYNENQRIDNENKRQNAESERSSAESERENAEDIRKQNEINRQESEAERISAENERQANEEDRVSNENNRENAESNRKADTAAAITNANNATTDAKTATQNAESAAEAANIATQNANTATQQANTVIEEMRSLIKDDNVVHISDKGIANGVATLDENGNIPASQLPSFVDDALEGIAVNTVIDETTGTKSAEGFVLVGETDPCTPESGKIYVDIDENVTYRWTGSVYVSIGSSLTLGTNSSTAFPGDRGLNLENRVTDIEKYHNNIPASDIKFDNSNTPLLSANVQTAIEDLTQIATPLRDGLLSADDKKKIDNYSDLQEIDAILLAANWTGNTAPFTQIITVENLLLYNNCSIEISPNATPIQIAAVTDGCITSIQYDESVGLVFSAFGEKPIVDIPIVLCVGTSMNIAEIPTYIDTPNKAEAISYDSSNGKITADNVQDAIDIVADTYLTKTGDTSSNTATFTSADSTSPTAWTDVAVLTSGEKHSSIFNKISTMFKNVRFLYKRIGTTDISAIGNGTLTGALSTLNNSLSTCYRARTGTYTGNIDDLIKSTDNGIYWVQIANATGTHPFSSGFYYLSVLNRTSNNAVQIAYQYSTCKMYVRMYTNTQWYPWSSFYTAAEVDTLLSTGARYHALQYYKNSATSISALTGTKVALNAVIGDWDSSNYLQYTSYGIKCLKTGTIKVNASACFYGFSGSTYLQIMVYANSVEEVVSNATSDGETCVSVENHPIGINAGDVIYLYVYTGQACYIRGDLRTRLCVEYI